MISRISLPANQLRGAADRTPATVRFSAAPKDAESERLNKFLMTMMKLQTVLEKTPGAQYEKRETLRQNMLLLAQVDSGLRSKGSLRQQLQAWFAMPVRYVMLQRIRKQEANLKKLVAERQVIIDTNRKKHAQAPIDVVIQTAELREKRKQAVDAYLAGAQNALSEIALERADAGNHA